MRFRVLGVVEVVDDGVVLTIKGRRQRLLLKSLLLDANQVVPAAQLIDRLWAADPPARAEHALHTAVSRLRAALGPAAGLIETVPGGYRIRIEPGQLDLADFRAAVERAGEEPDQQRRAELLSVALDTWRDVPIARTEAEAVLDGWPWLVEERFRATESLIEARLALGDSEALIPELRTLTKANPLRERFWAQLMRALLAAGRKSEALGAYRDLAAVLAKELGVDPGTEIRQLCQAIESDAGQTEPQPDGWRPRWLLPAPVKEFVGRDTTVDQLAAELTNPATLPVTIVSGAPGIGKSALAVQVGHRLRSHFPDGQWHVQLGAGRTPREPVDVLGDLLVLAGVEPPAQPADLDGRSALLRSRLAGRRVLIVLDDARDTQQVRPLLPGTAGCAVLVTSRGELTGLSVAVGARLTRLGLLGADAASALLAEVLGPERVAADPTGVHQLITLCGGLPLALRIAAALLATRADMSIAAFAAELATGDRLGRLAIGDGPDTAVAVAFGLSYESLPEPARRLFALLGVVPGNDLSVPAAAVLLDCPVHEAGVLLESLAAANLLQRERSRYRMHDLIRLYAMGRAEVEPGAGEAWLRLADSYLRTADAAAALAYRPHVRLTPRLSEVNPFEDREQAAAWIETEEANLVAAGVRAAELGQHAMAWQLADILRYYFAAKFRIVPWQRLTTVALRAAEAAGDRAGAGAMWHSLGVLHYNIGDVEAALTEYAEAAVRYGEIGFRPGQAATLCNSGIALNTAGDVFRAAELLEAGVRIFRELGRTGDLPPALQSLSNSYRYQGRFEQAIEAANEAIAIAPSGWPLHVALVNRGLAHQRLGRLAEAEADLTEALVVSERHSVSVYYGLALLSVELGELGQAMEPARKALDLSRQHGLEWHEGNALNVLGTIYARLTRWSEARAYHEQAREIAVRLGHRGTEADALAGLRAVAAGTGDRAAAERYAERAAEIARMTGYRGTRGVIPLV